MSIVAAAVRYLKSSRLRPDSLGRSQSNESMLVESLADKLAVPKTFCEFGFDITEFNCSRILRSGWRGLLIDGNAQRINAATRVLRKDPAIEVTAQCMFLDLDNLHALIHGFFGENRLGVLSIDVDGNDYWFLETLLPLEPVLVVVEYNASFGLQPISVPYDPRFDRHEKHSSGWYHGASLSALCSLSERNGYSLIAVSEAGGNAFFCHPDFMGSGFVARNASELYRENQLRNNWSKTLGPEQWKAIKHLPYERV
jgi:hypothetical protein